VRKVFLVIASLFVLSVVLQLYFAGVGHFSTGGGELFWLHGTNGRIILPILAILNIVAAAVARAGRRTIWLTVIALVLIFLQTVIFILTGTIFNISGPEDVIPVGASILLGFHALNGLAIIVLGSMVARRAFALDRTGRVETAVPQRATASVR
jgi:hypothetical protein